MECVTQGIFKMDKNATGEEFKCIEAIISSDFSSTPMDMSTLCPPLVLRMLIGLRSRACIIYSNAFTPLEFVIQKIYFQLCGRQISDVERIFSLPYRFGGLEILNPAEIADREYSTSD